MESRSKKYYKSRKGEKLPVPTRTSPRDEKIEYIRDSIRRSGHKITRKKVERMYADEMIKNYRNLDKFPPEMLQQIAFTLEYPDIIHLCTVSVVFNEKICEDTAFWKLLFRRDISDIPRELSFDFRKAYREAVVPRTTDETIEFAIKHSYEKQLQHFENYMKQDDNPESFLILALEFSTVPIIQYLLKLTNFDINNDSNSWELLNWSTLNPRLDAIQYIYNLLPEIDGNILDGIVAEAISDNASKDIIGFLIDKINASDNPLDYPRVRDMIQRPPSVDMINFVIERSGVNFDYANVALTSRMSLDVLEYFINRGANVNFAPHGINIPLASAVIDAKLDVLKLLYNHGAVPVGNGLVTLLQEASTNYDIVLFLIDKYHPSKQQLAESISFALPNFSTEQIEELIKLGVPVVIASFRNAISLKNYDGAKTIMKHLELTNKELNDIARENNLTYRTLLKKLGMKL